MKKLLFLTLVLWLAAMPARSQQASIEGYWEGAVVRDGAVRLIRFDIFKDGANLRCRVELPDFLNFSASSLRVQQDGVKIKLPVPMSGEFLLTHDPAAGEMYGVPTRQPAPPMTMHLKRSVKPVEAPVTEEEVQFSSGDITLAGTVIKPVAEGQHPVIVWLSGRGSSGRSNSALHRLLARQGIASLIYDKRGGGKSTGNFQNATFKELVSDAVAAVRFLSQRKDINAKQIGLHGSSAGGWVAPVVATQSEIPVAFIVTSVGPAENLYDQQVHAYQAYVRTGGFELTKEEVELSDQHILNRLRVAFKNEGREEFLASSAKIKGTRMERFLLDTEANDASDFDWLRRNDADPAPHLKKIKAPFLAFYGTRDYIVPPPQNAKKLEQYLTEAGNKDFKVVVIENADHGLTLPNVERRAGTETTDKPQWQWGRVALEYTQTMLDWLLAHVTVAPKR